jgi:hypothetical protein
MKTKQTQATLVLTSIGIALLTGATLLAEGPGSSHKGGTDILHVRLREKLHNEGVETNAIGWLELRENEQGHADHQSLHLSLRGLDTNAAYLLLAATTTNTNSQVVAQFDTDARGRASLVYNRSATGNGHAGGHWNHSLPDALNPVSGLRTLAIANSTTQAVLTADLRTPDRLEYLLKRTLINGDVFASLRIKTDRQGGDIRLFATGLSSNTDYFLAFNGSIAQTNHTDAHGRLAAGAELLSPFDILDLSTVALWDTTSNVVVSTQLP